VVVIGDSVVVEQTIFVYLKILNISAMQQQLGAHSCMKVNMKAILKL
jgi:hypothetical protein